MARRPPEIPRSRFNTNDWNRRRYTLWAPIYDWVTGGFHAVRRHSIAKLQLRPGQRVLIAGAGTGLDLPHLPAGLAITAVDLTPAMIERLGRRAEQLGLQLEARVMDAQALEFPAAAFDAVVLHLIVAVIPDPVRCLREAARVLKPGGRVVVMDKFLPPRGGLRVLLRMINPLMGLLASEVTRSLEPIVKGSGLAVESVESALAGGLFKIAVLRKP